MDTKPDEQSMPAKRGTYPDAYRDVYRDVYRDAYGGDDDDE